MVVFCIGVAVEKSLSKIAEALNLGACPGRKKNKSKILEVSFYSYNKISNAVLPRPLAFKDC